MMGDRQAFPDDKYLDALYSLVLPKTNKNPYRSYYLLFEQMHKKEFSWFIPNDDNRVEDGLELRYKLLGVSDKGDDPCSFLEMLIALSQRAAFESNKSTVVWFWHLMNNLNLADYRDEYYPELEPFEVEHIMDRVINRTYDADGLGGLFPMHNTRGDQREVEIWYQLASYLLEGYGP